MHCFHCEKALTDETSKIVSVSSTLVVVCKEGC